MQPLSSKKCIPCEAGAPPLTPTQIQELQLKLNKPWQIIENKKITKTFTFDSFKKTIKAVNKIAVIAEQEGHHPDMTIHYSTLIIELWTHAINGLSENDFILASKIDEIL